MVNEAHDAEDTLAEDEAFADADDVAGELDAVIRRAPRRRRPGAEELRAEAGKNGQRFRSRRRVRGLEPPEVQPLAADEDLVAVA